MKTVVWGAGREGRGFLADVFLPYAEVHLVDTDHVLVHRLRSEGGYRLLLRPPRGCTGERRVDGYAAWHVDDPSVLDHVASADVVALCVYLKDLPEAVARIADGLRTRAASNPGQPLDVLLCANSIHYGPRLREMFHAALPDSARDWFDARVGIVETLVRRTCVQPDEPADSLAVMTNAFPTLAADAGSAKVVLDGLPFIAPVSDMRMEERRKIYTYNLLHVTYAYLGHPKGYGTINESRDDAAIQAVAEGVFAEAGAAMKRRFGLDDGEMDRYAAQMWEYVVNPAMPDSIARTGCDPIRKLGHDERIIGPGLMCLEHGLPCDNIATVAAAAFRYDDPADPASQLLRDEVERYGVRACIRKYCGLQDDSPLLERIVRAY